jgi:thymidine phosphorylase
LPAAKVVAAAPPSHRGFVTAIDARAVGIAVVALGGGRARAADAIDPAVGFTELAGLGAEVSAAAPLALVHARDDAQAQAAAAQLAAAYTIGEALPPMRAPVVERIAGAAS